MKPRRFSRARWWMAALPGALLGCQTIVVAEIPPPRSECPTLEDTARLARLLPGSTDPAAAIELDAFGLRWVDAGSYCRMAAKRLK